MVQAIGKRIIEVRRRSSAQRERGLGEVLVMRQCHSGTRTSRLQLPHSLLLHPTFCPAAWPSTMPWHVALPALVTSKPSALQPPLPSPSPALLFARPASTSCAPLLPSPSARPAPLAPSTGRSCSTRWPAGGKQRRWRRPLSLRRPPAPPAPPPARRLAAPPPRPCARERRAALCCGMLTGR